MKSLLRSKLVLIGLFFGLGFACAVLNLVWVYHSGALSAGQIVFNILAGSGLACFAVILTLKARKNPDMLGFSDEYSEARKRYAAQIGVLVGLVLFVCSIFAKNLLPQAFDSLADSFVDKSDAFSTGHLWAGFTFYIGLLIGWAAAYIKYR